MTLSLFNVFDELLMQQNNEIVLLARLHFFSQRILINQWNSLSQEDIDSPSTNSFKNRLEKTCARQMDFFNDV